MRTGCTWNSEKYSYKIRHLATSEKCITGKWWVQWKWWCKIPVSILKTLPFDSCHALIIRGPCGSSQMDGAWTNEVTENTWAPFQAQPSSSTFFLYSVFAQTSMTAFLLTALGSFSCTLYSSLLWAWWHTHSQHTCIYCTIFFSHSYLHVNWNEGQQRQLTAPEMTLRRVS